MAKPFLEVTGGNENGMRLIKQSVASDGRLMLSIWHRTYLTLENDEDSFEAIYAIEKLLEQMRSELYSVDGLSEPLTLRFAMEDRGRIYKEWNNENPRIRLLSMNLTFHQWKMTIYSINKENDDFTYKISIIFAR